MGKPKNRKPVPIIIKTDLSFEELIEKSLRTPPMPTEKGSSKRGGHKNSRRLHA